MMEEEVIEQDDENTEETQFCMEEETDQTTWQIKQRKAPEIKQKFISIRKRFLGHPQKIMQVGSDDRWKTRRLKRTRDMIDHMYDPVEVKSPVVKRAEEVQAKLGSKFPTIIKFMLRSNVTSGFWMNFPRRFCNLHLPKHDTPVILVDEKGDEFKTKFLVGKSGLSGGWRAYSIAHNLCEGDALVFQFVRPSKSKVYTVRCDELTEVDGALGLLDLASCRIGFERDIKTCREARRKCSDSLWMDIAEENIQENTLNLHSVADQSKFISHDLGFNTSERMICSGSLVDFKEVQGNENSTLVNGFNIDSDLSEYHSNKYYKLCCQQNLHLDGLHENSNGSLAAEVISEATNIEDAIEGCILSTSHADDSISNKTLEGFELGMLRAHLNLLVSVAYKSEEAPESKRYKEAILERTCLEEEIRTLELKDAMKRISKMLNRLSLQEEFEMHW